LTNPVPWGGEFLVNSTTANDQTDATITALPDGGFVVAWTGLSAVNPAIGLDVLAQVFNADGSPRGAEIQLFKTYDQNEPTITALSDGRFVVVWTDFSESQIVSRGSASLGQFFNADGSLSGSRFEINQITSGSQNQPSVAAIAGGGFVAVWTDLSQTSADTSGSAIKARYFSGNGYAQQYETLINFNSNGDQKDPSVTTLSNGSFVVTWVDNSLAAGDTDGSSIMAKVYRSPLSTLFLTPLTADFLVNTSTANSQSQPVVAALSEGRFVVSWMDDGGDGSAFSVKAQVFNADASRSGVELLVNTTLASDQQRPTIAALPDGRFVIAWADASQTGGDTSGDAVRAQVFNADGSQSGAEFLVNTTTSGDQNQPTLSVLADGRFVVAWTNNNSERGDASGSSIHAQIFDARLAPVNVAGSSQADLRYGTAWNDTLNGGAGNDTLVGGAGDDILMGGTGDDSFEVDSLGDTVVELANEGIDRVTSSQVSLDLGRAALANVEHATLTGFLALDLSGNSSYNILTGNSAANILLGQEGNDSLYGAAGDDILDGGEGDNLLVGGEGDDTYVLNSVGDRVIEATNEGNDTLISATLSLDLDRVEFANVENAQLTGFLALRLFGSALDNVLRGNSAANILLGLDGDDSLYGGAGADLLMGGAGHDILVGGAGADTLIGGQGDDIYWVNSVADRVLEDALAGNDHVISRFISLDLAAYAQVENAQLRGTLSLNLTGNNGANTLQGNGGSNVLMGLGGNDTLGGGAGQDSLFGGTGNDSLEGGSGADTLDGGSGQDTLVGGTGKDVLTGGSGADTFFWRSSSEAGLGGGRDVVTDFVVGLDKIDFTAIDADTVLDDHQSFSFLGSSGFSGVAGQLRYTVSSGAGLLAADTNGDGVADFHIQLTGQPALTLTDLVL